MWEAVANMEQRDQGEQFRDRFRSRPRVLAGWFQNSREQWKRKHRGLKQRVKRLRVQVADVRSGREKWKAQAQCRWAVGWGVEKLGLTR